MNVQQLRYVRETIRCGLNLTAAAQALHTSQPGISRQIRELEDELGIEFFVRRGKRVIDLTESGKMLAPIVERVLQEIDNLRSAADELRDQDAGALVVATTHTQARYTLPPVVAEFKREFPRVRLSLRQGNPPQIADMVLRGAADIGIASEALDQYPGLLALPGYSWQHCVVAPPDHPLLAEAHLSLEALARYPLVTYDPAFAGRSHIDEAFAARGLGADIVLAAIDSDVIKTYVELGLGVGVIAAMAFDPERDRGLRMLDASHLFRTNMARVALLRGRRLRVFTFAFVEKFAPHLSRQVVEKAMAGAQESYEL
jgi:DNA-binding transcriptional LysR family regulator